jgi:cytochrome P450
LIQGPIIRINPEELHIYDPQFYSEIYAGKGRKVNKYEPAIRALGVPRASLGTVEHDLHRVRREILSPYFSKRSITRLEPFVHERIDQLATRLEQAMHQKTVVDLDSAFTALTADIASYFFYGSLPDYLGKEAYAAEMKDAIRGLINFFHFTRFVPMLADSMKMLPIPILRLVHPGAADLLASRVVIRREIVAKLGNEKSEKSQGVIIDALKDPNIPAADKTIDRLQDEGVTIIFAGTETTARALSVTMFHLMHDKSIFSRLRRELAFLPPVEGNRYTLSELASLPYLVSYPHIKRTQFPILKFYPERCSE